MCIKIINILILFLDDIYIFFNIKHTLMPDNIVINNVNYVHFKL